MMSFFRKKSKAKKSQETDTHGQIGPKNVEKESNREKRSKIDENILRNGPDEGFVWYEET